MTARAPLTRFSWEQAVAGPDGPPSSTTRLVLLVIGMHCRRKGSLQCWPSIRALEAATRLSQRCIIDQIESAIVMGWLSRQTGQAGDMRRRGSIYTLTMPTAERRSAVGESATAERASAVQHRQPLNGIPPTAERSSVRPLNVIPPLLTSEVRRKKEEVEVARKGNGQDAQHGKPTDLQAWAATAGLSRSAGESEEQFRRRAGDAYVKSLVAQSRSA